MQSDSFTEEVTQAHMSLEDLQTRLSSYESSVILLDGQEKISANLEGFVHTVPRISLVEQFETALEEEDIHSLVPEYLRISEAERNWQDNQ